MNTENSLSFAIKDREILLCFIEADSFMVGDTGIEPVTSTV